MKKTLLILIVLGLTGCGGLDIESLTYTLPNGQVATCVPHPVKEGFMQCAYMDGPNEVVVAIRKDLIKRN